MYDKDDQNWQDVYPIGLISKDHFGHSSHVPN